MKQLILNLVLLIFATPNFANTSQNIEPTKQSIFDLVNYQEVQEVTLELDLEKLLEGRRKEETYKGTFAFKDKNGKDQVWKTKVKIRGKFRRIHCPEMPPLKLNFKKGDLAEAGLNLHDDFKLVTHCIEDEEEAKNLLLKEYLAYRIYNELTDYSFRVQFLKINYKDKISGTVKKQWGFIIEDTAQMRTRLEGKKHEGIFGLKKETYQIEHAKRVALFQYMIGNLDYGMYKKLHNVKVIQKSDGLIPIPYDFDFSGFVSAPYARLNPNYEVKSIKDRLYLDDPKDLESMEETVTLFQSKKESILSILKNCNQLKKQERRELQSYLKSFYKEIENIKLPVVNNNQTTNLSTSK